MLMVALMSQEEEGKSEGVDGEEGKWEGVDGMSEWEEYHMVQAALHSRRMVLSGAAVSSLVEVGYQCPHDSYPDDMFLGTVAKQLGMYIVHSTAFHQVAIWLAF